MAVAVAPATSKTVTGTTGRNNVSENGNQPTWRRGGGIVVAVERQGNASVTAQDTLNAYDCMVPTKIQCILDQLDGTSNTTGIAVCKINCVAHQ